MIDPEKSPGDPEKGPVTVYEVIWHRIWWSVDLNKAHLHDDGFIDAKKPKVGGDLSKDACKCLVDRLERGKGDGGLFMVRTAPLGRTTQYAYDAFGCMMREQGPPPAAGQPGPLQNFGYDAADNLRIAVDGRRNFVEYRYDARDRLVATLDADPDGPGGPLTPSTTSFTYDAAGQRLSSVDALSRTTSCQYDRLGRTVLVTAPDPDGGGTQWPSRTSYEYNNFGELAISKQDLQVTANSGVYLITQYAYDRLGRVISTTDPRNAVTGFAYDKAGNRTRVTDPLNNDTVFTYDRLNRLTQEQNELNLSRTYADDAMNNLTSRTDRNGRTVTYGYDPLDRRTTERWSGTTYVASYTYDLADQLTQASDGVATYGYSYDGLGRATTITHTLAGSGMPGPVTFSQLFDLADNRTRLAATIGGVLDFRNIYTYDGMNRMTRVTQAGQTGGNAVAEKRVDFAYAADSQWQTITRYQDLAGTKLVAVQKCLILIVRGDSQFAGGQLVDRKRLTKTTRPLRHAARPLFR